VDFGTRKHLGVEGTNLTIGGVDAIALSKRYGTPLYAIDEERIRDNFRRFAAAFSGADLYYAAKANGSLALLRI